MTQVNPIRTAQPNPLKIGDRVRCDLFPEMVLTIVEIDRRTALLRTPRGNERWVGLHRLSRA